VIAPPIPARDRPAAVAPSALGAGGLPAVCAARVPPLFAASASFALRAEIAADVGAGLAAQGWVLTVCDALAEVSDVC
jgi:hypothetical protein